MGRFQKLVVGVYLLIAFWKFYSILSPGLCDTSVIDWHTHTGKNTHLPLSMADNNKSPGRSVANSQNKNSEDMSFLFIFKWLSLGIILVAVCLEMMKTSAEQLYMALNNNSFINHAWQTHCKLKQKMWKMKIINRKLMKLWKSKSMCVCELNKAHCMTSVSFFFSVTISFRKKIWIKSYFSSGRLYSLKRPGSVRTAGIFLIQQHLQKRRQVSPTFDPQHLLFCSVSFIQSELLCFMWIYMKPVATIFSSLFTSLSCLLFCFMPWSIFVVTDLKSSMLFGSLTIFFSVAVLWVFLHHHVDSLYARVQLLLLPAYNVFI